MTEEIKNKNNNKKKIKTTLGTIVIIAGIGFTAYSINKNYKENNFTRIVSEDGNYELDGFINYDGLNKYSVVEIETITGENKIYIAKENCDFSKTNVNYKMVQSSYYDIYSDELIGIDLSTVGEITDISSVDTPIVEKDTVISSTNISEFLIAYDMIKGKYSSDDIDYLLNRIKDDYQNNENLKLVKTKSE